MPPIGSTKWLDIVGWWIAFCIGCAILGLLVIAVRYAFHPQQFRDVHNDVVRTVYVWAKPAKTP